HVSAMGRGAVSRWWGYGPQAREAAAMVNIRKIVCAIDFFHTSRRGFQEAVALARWYGAEIRALYVCPIALVPPIPGLPENVETAERHRLVEQARTFIATIDHAGVNVDVVVEEGEPWERILSCAEAWGSDLLV